MENTEKQPDDATVQALPEGYVNPCDECGAKPMNGQCDCTLSIPMESDLTDTIIDTGHFLLVSDSGDLNRCPIHDIETAREHLDREGCFMIGSSHWVRKFIAQIFWPCEYRCRFKGGRAAVGHKDIDFDNTD